MQIDLSGKTALVTGSTQGIGLAIAESLAASGARVAINGRNAERVETAIDGVRNKLGDDAALIGVAADVSPQDGVDELVAQLPHVDILVNNLGIFGAPRRWRSPTNSGATTSTSTSSPPRDSSAPTCRA